MIVAYESELYIILKICLIVLGWFLYKKSDRIANGLFVFWEKLFITYMSALCAFYKFTFRGFAIILVIISAIWIYQPNLKWVTNLIYYGHL